MFDILLLQAALCAQGPDGDGKRQRWDAIDGETPSGMKSTLEIQSGRLPADVHELIKS